MAAEEKLYRVALREALAEEMERDESGYLIGEDIGKFGGAYRVTEGLLDRFGEKRGVGAPIAEEVIVGSAIGSRSGGGGPPWWRVPPTSSPVPDLQLPKTAPRHPLK